MSSSDEGHQPSVPRTRRRLRNASRDFFRKSPSLHPENYTSSSASPQQRFLSDNSWDVTTTEEESSGDLESDSESNTEVIQSPPLRRQRNQLKQRQSSEENDLYPSQRRNKFHYSNYYKHFYRRANYGQFSISVVLRRWVMASSTFTSKYYKEIVLVLCCIASALASLRSGAIKTKPVGHPVPFFSVDDFGLDTELIIDLYRGEYVDLARNQIPFYSSFLFYYAHWDSESIHGKNVFVEVVKYFQKTKPGQFKFFAINCWWPDGQCRQNYNSLSHFPIFVAHASSTMGVIYNGPIRAELMIRFLETILKPITRLDTEEELWTFRAQHDAIMLTSMNSGHVDFDAAFILYRQMALRNLEADPLSQIGFGLCLKKELGEKFYLATDKTISLILFNEIHTAKWILPEKGMKGPISQVAAWVSERTSSLPLTWSYPVRNGFATKVITPGAIDLSETLDKRPLFLLLTRRYPPSSFSPFYSQVKEVALDYFNCNKSANVTRLRRMTHKVNAELMKLWDSLTKICQGIPAFEKSSLKSWCDQMRKHLKHWTERKRQFIRESLQNFEKISDSLNFTGLSCRTARPFQFLAIDPVEVPHFTQLALGKPKVNPYDDAFSINRTSYEKQMTDPVAFIIDGENQVILPFNSFNISEIARVLNNFTIELEEGRTIRDISGTGDEGQGEKQESSKAKKFTGILNLTVQDLNDLLATSEHSLLVMYSAEFCGFCTVTLTQFVRLAEFLKEFDISVQLAKIDTYKHPLPLALSPETIPTFVFFPAYNRSDSRLLSTNQPLTAQSLLKFLLSQLDAKTRVKLSLLHKKSIPSKLEGIQKNKEIILNRLDNLLEALRSDESFTKYHETEADTNLEFDLDPETLSAWKLEVLEKLRSIQLRLDTIN